tara:strand:+ start:1208 stop:1783 length:576 start_codon:yes stop_codon:yes gene_type:complete
MFAVKFRKRDYAVRVVPHAVASRFIVAHHYARGTANTSSVSLGLFPSSAFWNDDIIGACLYMSAPKKAVESLSGIGKNEALSLSRLAIHPDVPTNGASFLIGASIRHIRRTLPHIRVLMSWADEGQGHLGQIYRATNWEYVGPTGKNYSWVDADGKRVSLYCAGRSIPTKVLDAKYKRIGPFRKHKFVFWM